jgi:adenylate cyclase
VSEPDTSRRGLVVGLVLGLPIIGYGVRGVLVDAADTEPTELATWIVGAGLVDDLLLVPLVLGAGLVGRRLVPPVAWPAVRAGLTVTGALCLVAWPFVRGYGRDPTIPSLLNRNYGAGLAAAIAVVWAGVAVWLTISVTTTRGRPGHGSMSPTMVEIERKFRVAVENVPPLGEGTRLRQAYVAVDGDVEVRVRDKGGTHLLTVKGGRGVERAEVEVGIDAASFDELWQLAPDRRIEKTRHDVPLDEHTAGHTAELDIYEGALEGLAVVEVEFASRQEADGFVPPPWFGEEVTGDPHWSNAGLAAGGRPPTG